MEQNILEAFPLMIQTVYLSKVHSLQNITGRNHNAGNVTLCGEAVVQTVHSWGVMSAGAIMLGYTEAREGMINAETLQFMTVLSAETNSSRWFGGKRPT